MRIDWYTKGVLTVIAVLLAVIAFKQYVSPDAVVQAQGAFAGVQYTGSPAWDSFFDVRTGEVYGYFEGKVLQRHYRLTTLGASPVTVK
jgi:hypothetical protein